MWFSHLSILFVCLTCLSCFSVVSVLVYCCICSVQCNVGLSDTGYWFSIDLQILFIVNVLSQQALYILDYWCIKELFCYRSWCTTFCITFIRFYWLIRSQLKILSHVLQDHSHISKYDFSLKIKIKITFIIKIWKVKKTEYVYDSWRTIEMPSWA